MSLHRYAARRDTNERAIIQVLEGVGAFVVQLSGEGVPDLLIRYRDKVIIAEVVGESKDKRYRTSNGLSPAQVHFHQQWGRPIPVLRTPQEALAVIGVNG